MRSEAKLFISLLAFAVVLCIVSAEECNTKCENDKKKVCGTSVKPKKYDTIKTFDNECLLRKHNCERPDDGEDSREYKVFHFLFNVCLSILEYRVLWKNGCKAEERNH